MLQQTQFQFRGLPRQTTQQPLLECQCGSSSVGSHGFQQAATGMKRWTNLQKMGRPAVLSSLSHLQNQMGVCGQICFLLFLLVGLCPEAKP